MGDQLRKFPRLAVNAKIPFACGAALISVLLAGCSTDISRFDYPAFGLTSQNPQSKPVPAVPVGDNGIPAPVPNYGAVSAAPPPDYTNYGVGNAAPQRYGYGHEPADGGLAGPAVRMAGSPPYSDAAGPVPSGFGTVPGQPESYHPERLVTRGQTAYIAVPAAGLPPSAGAAPTILPPVGASAPLVRGRRPTAGATVEVLPGETLYQFSRRNGISIAAVMQANNLRSPMVQPGQKLIIPGKGGRSILPPIAQAEPASLSAAPVAPAATVAPAAPAPAAIAFAAGADDNPDGTYTVRAGDSVYGIARKHNVRPQDIMSANGLSDVTKVKFGQILKMPGATASVAAAGDTMPAATEQAPGSAWHKASAKATQTGKAVMSDADGIPDPASSAADEAIPAGPVAPPPPPAVKPALQTASKPAPTSRSGPVDPASVKVATAQPDAMPAASVASDGRFRWPVRGRIIGKFGPAGKDAPANEGIDLSVPLGTEVHAAENGVVAYSGDELKGYGKLILIRHADNWVTAYAHNDELLVKRGDQIRRGQIIAKAGKSGGIDQPLLHFELRKGSQPVDPMPHMASN